MPDPAEQESQESQDYDLRSKAFGCCDADLRPRVHVNPAITFASDRAADTVANSKGTVSFASALTQGGQSIDRLAALAYGEYQGVLGHRYVSVAKLAGKLYLSRNMGEILNEAFADSACMKGRTAGAQNDAFDVAQFTGGHVESAELGR